MERILIIDDDPDVRALVSSFLNKNGFEVETASYKEEAFEKVLNYKPHVVLMDVLLSGSDGRTFCKEIKNNDQTENTSVIMFSAHPAVAAERIKDYGADDFITKPFSLPFLLERIQKQLNK